MNQDSVMNVGIIGTGWIAAKAAETLAGMKNCKAYAIGSRNLETAINFADKWNIPNAYGNYNDLIQDPQVDLVYIGTPHSNHFEVAREAILAGKPCLVEKAFMANHHEAKEILDLAREKNVFVAEAIWTRYQPVVKMVKSIIQAGTIGVPRLITATLAYQIIDKKRLLDPELCGGALLDLGVYVINFVRMFTQSPISFIDGNCVMTNTGVDLTNAITIILENGILANIQSCSNCVGDNIGVISGTEGNLIIDNVNNPQKVTVNTHDRIFLKEISVPSQITGYEYQFEACRRDILNRRLEPEEMPWNEILYIMELMDDLREKWGVRYPADKC